MNKWLRVLMMLVLMPVMLAAAAPFTDFRTSGHGASPPPVQEAMALSGNWTFSFGSTTNNAVLEHLSGLMLRMTGAGELDERYLKQDNMLLRFKGRGSEHLNIVWFIEGDSMTIRDGDYAGAILKRAPEDKTEKDGSVPEEDKNTEETD